MDVVNNALMAYRAHVVRSTVLVCTVSRLLPWCGRLAHFETTATVFHSFTHSHNRFVATTTILILHSRARILSRRSSSTWLARHEPRRRYSTAAVNPGLWNSTSLPTLSLGFPHAFPKQLTWYRIIPPSILFYIFDLPSSMHGLLESGSSPAWTDCMPMSLAQRNGDSYTGM